MAEENSLRVLVCGTRTWDDPRPIEAVLNGLLWDSPDGGVVLIEGGASGADRLAWEWYEGPADDVEDLRHIQYPADWATHGKAAGPIRNQQMIDEGKPDLVVAFTDQPRTRGTNDMVCRAKDAGIPVWVIGHG